MFLIRKLSGMVDVFCSIVAYMCGGERNIILCNVRRGLRASQRNDGK